MPPEFFNPSRVRFREFGDKSLVILCGWPSAACKEPASEADGQEQFYST